jgi:hypothetical protein
MSLKHLSQLESSVAVVQTLAKDLGRRVQGTQTAASAQPIKRKKAETEQVFSQELQAEDQNIDSAPENREYEAMGGENDSDDDEELRLHLLQQKAERRERQLQAQSLMVELRNVLECRDK